MIRDFLEEYRIALLIRTVEERIADEYAKGDMRCPVHLSIGQEGTAVAFSQLVDRSDYCVSSHRAHAHYLAKGGPVEGLIGEILGKPSGCSRGRGGSMHLTDPECNFVGSIAILGAAIPVAVGLGLTLARKGSVSSVSAVFFGDGATEEGVFYESLNLAAVLDSPCLFICENNGFSVYSPLSVRQPAERQLAQVAASLGVVSRRSPSASYEDTFETLEWGFASVRARRRPALVELFTQRRLEHCGPHSDDHLGYRSDEDIAVLNVCDPITSIEQSLVALDVDIPKTRKFILDEINTHITQVFEDARRENHQAVNLSEQDMYAD